MGKPRSAKLQKNIVEAAQRASRIARHNGFKNTSYRFVYMPWSSMYCANSSKASFPVTALAARSFLLDGASSRLSLKASA